MPDAIYVHPKTRTRLVGRQIMFSEREVSDIEWEKRMDERIEIYLFQLTWER